MDAQICAREIEHQRDANQTEWHGEHDDERVEERAELNDHDQIDQHDGEDEPEAERLKRVAHGLHFAAHLDVITFRHFGAVVADSVDVFLDVRRH